MPDIWRRSDTEIELPEVDVTRVRKPVSIRKKGKRVMVTIANKKVSRALSLLAFAKKNAITADVLAQVFVDSFAKNRRLWVSAGKIAKNLCDMLCARAIYEMGAREGRISDYLEYRNNRCNYEIGFMNLFELEPILTGGAGLSKMREKILDFYPQGVIDTMNREDAMFETFVKGLEEAGLDLEPLGQKEHEEKWENVTNIDGTPSKPKFDQMAYLDPKIEQRRKKIKVPPEIDEQDLRKDVDNIVKIITPAVESLHKMLVALFVKKKKEDEKSASFRARRVLRALDLFSVYNYGDYNDLREYKDVIKRRKILPIANAGAQLSVVRAS